MSQNHFVVATILNDLLIKIMNVLDSAIPLHQKQKRKSTKKCVYMTYDKKLQVSANIFILFV